jgi:diadenosine tetraphosphate (Ap4A) HIT family hydrolase
MAPNKCPFCEWLKDIRAKEPHRVVAEMKASWLVLSASQAYRGYCMLIAKTHAKEVFQLPEKERRRLFDDLALASQAIYKLFKPDKLNYEILGNQTPHLHCHIIPRRNSDPIDREYPIWGQVMDEPRMSHGDYHALAESIALELGRLGAAGGTGQGGKSASKWKAKKKVAAKVPRKRKSK